MCNLYSITRGQEAMRRLFAIERDLAGNLPPMPGVPTCGGVSMARLAFRPW